MARRKKVIAAAVVGSLLSIVGLQHIASKEGLSLTAYPDPGTNGAPWTICYGHTRGVYRGMVATKAQCDHWLREDTLVAERAVQKHVRVPLMQGEYDAYTSFVFNVGETQFRKSTMLALLNAGDHRAACNQFPRWIYANKRVLNGLVVRRTEEQAMCHQVSKVVYHASP